ncbi:hypothetical protein FIA58_018090 [Flavobacterium jejuense]|uniref:DUF551 domain-containing protein n=1 Tax=Flavobacterium jejuense TaxID=1544455 RepID=A0ABX0IWL1_9FLAO|nr:hypothetical protein [Flavobacterium jejuense]NHN27595.1 hypothetical protein [Flavobacterium jejuense]
MSKLELTSELSESIQAQLSQDFMDSCKNSVSKKALADLVYNKAIQNPYVLAPQPVWTGQLNTFWVVLTQIGMHVNLGGTWITFGAYDAKGLYEKGAFYDGSSQITVGEVMENAVWMP